ncbi:MAG: hypothetical protein IJ083_12220 [Clostridia bacterium]|nr:hypothetical protein [Clostridia bacterium]
MKKLLVLVLGLLLALSLSAAGAEGISGRTYVTSQPGTVEQMGWYTNNTSTVIFHEDGTYELIFRRDAFGGEDLDPRGCCTIIYKGTWTDAEPEDEETSHRDVTLAPVESVYYLQSGKLYTRSGGTQVLDTDNWTDSMTEQAGMDRDAFLEMMAQEYVLVIEEPALDEMDETLIPQIFEMPDLVMPAIQG